MVKLLPIDKNKNKITAGVDENFTFYSDVNSRSKGSGSYHSGIQVGFLEGDLGSTVGEMKLNGCGLIRQWTITGNKKIGLYFRSTLLRHCP